MREPRGVVARIIPFNHPFMFCAGKSAAPLAAGNAVIIKPPEQAPLSALRLAELIGDILPPGVFNVIPGGREVGAILTSHPDIAMVALIGSVPTGRAVMKAAADTIKPVLLELGGKNALIAFPDADPDEVAAAVVGGMNFTWCGQSCGSTSRAFLHEAIYDAVVERIAAQAAKFRPGLPTDPATTMGAIASKAQYDRVLRYIETARQEGARLVCGGGRPTGAGTRTGLVHRADRVRRCHHGHDHRPRGDLRPGALRAALARRSDNAGAGQPSRIRPDLLDLDQRHQPRPSHRHAGAGRLRLDQRSQPAFPRLTFRRLQAVRHWARGVPGGIACFYAGEAYSCQIEVNKEASASFWKKKQKLLLLVRASSWIIRLNGLSGSRLKGNALFGSDAVADALRALDIPYIALNPGASYRGLHDSLVNHLGNAAPQMLLCLHEEHAVAIAQGWAKVTGTPMLAAVHSNVGLFHATMAIFNAWCDRMPVIVLGATGPLDAAKRRPWIEWIHTAQDQGAIVRPYVKWDAQPDLPRRRPRSHFPRRLAGRHRPDGAGLRQPRCRPAGGAAARPAAAARPRPPHAAGADRRARPA